MNKIKKTLSAFLTILLLVSAFGVTAFAEGGNTTLTTTIPCTVTLQVGEHGKVTVDGTDYTGNASFQRDAGTAVTYTFSPNGLYSVDKVIYDGTEVTSELSGNTWTAPALTGNAALSVSFKLIGGGTPTYTVTFDANGHGTAPAAQTVLSGNTAFKPVDPTASGWSFGGWYKEAACTNAFDFSIAITADITLYAKWTKDSSGEDDPPTPVTKYTITYDLNGGTLDGKTGKVTIEVEKDTTITLPKPTRSGYTFDYWEGSRYDAGASYTVTGDHTFTAQWKANTTPTNPDTGGKDSSPKTGDESHIGLWIALMALSLIGIGGVTVYGKRRKTDR